VIGRARPYWWGEAPELPYDFREAGGVRNLNIWLHQNAAEPRSIVCHGLDFCIGDSLRPTAPTSQLKYCRPYHR
jgi:hypothetical protein